MLKPGQTGTSGHPDKNSFLVVFETQVAEANHLIPSSGMLLAFSILPREKEEREKLGEGREGPKLTPKQGSVVNSQWSPGVATAAVLGLWSPSWAGLLTSSKGDEFVVGHGGNGRKLSIYFKTPSPCIKGGEDN